MGHKKKEVTYHEVDTSFEFWSPPRKQANGHHYNNHHTDDLRPNDKTQEALLDSIVKVNGCGHISDNDVCSDKNYVHKQNNNGCDKIAGGVGDNGGNVKAVVKKGVVVEKVVLDDVVVQEVNRKSAGNSVKNNRKTDRKSAERVVDDTEIVVHTDLKKKQKVKEKKESKTDLAKVHKDTKTKKTTDINSIKINIEKQHKSTNTLEVDPMVDHTTQTQENTILSENVKLWMLPDLENTLDYLLRNKALSQQECDQIMDGEKAIENVTEPQKTEPPPTTEQAPSKQHLHQERCKRLLKIVDSRPSIRPLFTNALRMTGQFELANLCDLTPRIHPLSGSGYLSKARRKGQVELKARVTGMKTVDSVTFRKIVHMLHPDWSSLQDLANHNEKDDTVSLRASVVLFAKKKRKNRCCICCCFAAEEESEENSKIKENLVVSQQPTNSTVLDDMDNIKATADRVADLCDRLNEQLVDPESALHADLVRYIEQDRGVLLLEVVAQQHKAYIKCICTQLQQAIKMEADINAGSFSQELSTIVDAWVKKYMGSAEGRADEGSEEMNEKWVEEFEGVSMEVKVVGGSSTWRDVVSELS